MPAADLRIHPEQAAQIISREGLSVREDTLYSNQKGVPKKGIRKRADKVLARLHNTLQQVLEPEETILYVAQAQAPVNVFEQLSFGWFIYYITRTFLVFTNRRVLHFDIKPKGFGGWSWARSLRAVRWGDIAEARVKGWLLTPSLRLRYQSGKKETYWGLRRRDAKKIKVLLAALLPASVGEGSAAQAMVSLCPSCQAELTPRVFQCRGCGVEFRSEREMMWRSLLFPGGGYFYAGQWTLGFLDAVVESILIGFTLGFLLLAAGFPQAALGPLEPSITPQAALAIAGVVALFLFLEKLVTIYHGRRLLRRFVLAEGKPKPFHWAAVGLAGYALAGLLAWAQVSTEEPVARVADDLTVRSVHFGLFQQHPNNTVSFTPASSVPGDPGQAYGWVIRIMTPRPSVHVREEYYVMATREGAQDTSVETTQAPKGFELVNVNEDDITPEGGLILSSWYVAPDELQGERRIDVYLEDTLVRSFVFFARGTSRP